MKNTTPRVWEFLFNSDLPEWVTVRDLKNDLAYEGWVHAFSDTCEPNELFLRDVKVIRNSTGDELYSIGGLYLSRERAELTIELPAIELTGYAKRPAGEGVNVGKPVKTAA